VKHKPPNIPKGLTRMMQDHENKKLVFKIISPDEETKLTVQFLLFCTKILAIAM
jgi:hypothetical protein